MSQTLPVSGTGAVRTKEKPPARTLRDLRHERGLKLTDAAHRIGVHPARLSELERGIRAPQDIELHALARYYGRRLEVGLVIREAA